MVNIIGYRQVTVGDGDQIEEPIYDEPIVVVGSGENRIVRSLAEYEAEVAAEQAAEEALQQEYENARLAAEAEAAANAEAAAPIEDVVLNDIAVDPTVAS